MALVMQIIIEPVSQVQEPVPNVKLKRLRLFIKQSWQPWNAGKVLNAMKTMFVK